MALSASPLSTQAVAKSRATLAGLDEALVGEKRDATRPEVLVLADGLTLSISPSAASLDDEGEKKAPPPVKIEKVVNAWGSAAGAGSDFFDRYRMSRNAELKRLEEMEADWRKKVEAEEFQLQRHRRILEAQEKNRHARERRKRRKTKKTELRNAAKIAGRRGHHREEEREEEDTEEEEREDAGDPEREEECRERRRTRGKRIREAEEASEEERETLACGPRSTQRQSSDSPSLPPSAASHVYGQPGPGREEETVSKKRRQEDGETRERRELDSEKEIEGSTQTEVEKMKPGMVTIKDDEW
ncbi:hypothetical protein TGPRC2_270790 [Toxoplasma gondii TgCatPRC2]|uniref:Uncharacterized protein n=7 Tax=Toxoplasma gondii TaxID=5811 RepID=B6KD22_TOXGV|nr:hypothetical protein TGME49_270790 [Toxoplasma gondii ME49]ESS36134.1 hypothetical protein TGVEG_270790 [Toxoplasma gondii VEG]KFG52121.1 hypothetical protein TGP89_270790 [Toxoplasma gondii p89]KFH05906.1 hypothetical protein TGVAND_270790 [Toxoplasma gondii VAND]KYF46813.1 hypothetical protein TGARI_270790 [Toxoplasma gondii ARI]KYK71070.1 hypothetical protein TGPRC2_270790 [Toxoplasma gondii TgCatPRC2]|eukprot:XP_002365745.1 hypothetical protein TGME49_270790 [Toxoplasma gondii ME49]